MRKKYIIILLAIITIIAGVIIGVWLSSKNKTSNLEPETKSQLAKTNQNIKNEIQTVETINKEIKTSPNCLFVFQTYYKECNHTINKKQEIPKECVNQTEEELQEKYKDFAIKEFTSNQVTFYEEKEGICNEHYIIKDNNGYVAIYTIDSFGKETLKETTEIVTSYLPETDKIRLKEGIKVTGQEELNACIEDYE